MREWIKDLWEDKVIFSLFVSIIILVIIMFSMLGIVIYNGIDNQHNYISQGKVIEMQFIKHHYEWSGKVMIYKKDKYIITITDGNKKYHTDIPKNEFERLKIFDWYKLKK